MLQSEFRDSLDADLRLITFSSGVSNNSALAEYVCKLLEDSGELTQMDLASVKLALGPRGKRAKIDAYGYDEIDDTLYLLVADAVETSAESTLTKTDADSIFSQLTWFVECALSDSLRSEIPHFEEAAQFAWAIAHVWPRVQKVKLVLATNRTLSDRIRSYSADSLGGKPTEAQIWDESRLYDITESKSGRENIRVVLSDFESKPIPMLAVATETNGVKTYLAVLSGVTLAKIFDRYGSRLLEGNVRGFLSARGKVNKGIRSTILGSPSRFLIFNNGITATANAVELDSSGALLAIDDLQIVNGGQTTASLYNFLKNDKAELAKLLQTNVAMKLIVVDSALGEELVPLISQYSNSQNKVTDADFAANSPFHLRMEEVSKRLIAPATGGSQISTRWYYERARGSFANERARANTSATALRKFEDMHPRGQQIDKTDLGTFHSILNRRPHYARKGGQKNFKLFSDEVAPRFQNEETRAYYSDAYYKKIVCTKILFSATRKAIMDSGWWTPGYLADLTTYGVSKFIQVVEDAGLAMPWEAIWLRQGVSQEILQCVVECAELSKEAILDPTRRQQNVTEWAKSEDCWKAVSKLPFAIPQEVRQQLAPKESARDEAKETRELGRQLNEVEVLKYLFSIPSTYWDEIQNNPRVRISPSVSQTLKQVTQGGAYTLDKRRASALMDLIEEAFNEGIQRPVKT